MIFLANFLLVISVRIFFFPIFVSLKCSVFVGLCTFSHTAVCGIYEKVLPEENCYDAA